MKGLFVTGTDTDVGKTFITAGLARLLRRRGVQVRVSKPVVTGAISVDGRWIGEDTRLLADAAQDEDLESITPWTFPEPAAPPVAARQVDVALTLDGLERAVRDRWKPGTFLLVEGVGGLLCPLTETETVADLVAALGFPILVIARRSLGTLNHTLLTLEVAKQRGLDTIGLVVTETVPVQSLAERTNVEELRRRVEVPILAVVPHQTDKECSWEEEFLGTIDIAR